MLKETIINAKTIDLAVEAGARELGVTADKVKFEVLEEPKKGILGIGAADAIVKVTYENTPADIALDFIQTILSDMGFDPASAALEDSDEEGASITVSGENLGLLIGRHGDVLDSIQYLVSLAANKGRENYYRINVDIENYRQKRAETLKTLAVRMANKALKYKRSFALEPMNAYERRIIHTELQTMEGITTYSVGNNEERKVVIAPDKKQKVTKTDR